MPDPDYILSPPFQRDPNAIRNGTPFVGQSTVEDESIVLVNDGWFPDVVVRDFRLRRQIDNTHVTERIIDVLQAAISQVNSELAGFVSLCSEQGFNALAEVPSPKIGNEPVKMLAYFRAVYSTAQALLNYRYWAVADTVGKNQNVSGNNMSSLGDSADEYQKERWEALQLVRGEPRTISGLL